MRALQIHHFEITRPAQRLNFRNDNAAAFVKLEYWLIFS
jgi:hypothetical protein